jgi:hypothetical protein
MQTRLSPAFLPLVILVGACGPSPFAQHVEAAKAAKARGDLYGEASNYDAACQLEPKEKEACAAATDAMARLKKATLAAGKVPCEAGQIDACVKELAPFRGLRGTDAELLTMLDVAGQAHAKECAGMDDGKSLDANVVSVVCLEEAQQPLSISTYDALVRDRRTASAQRLVTLSDKKASGERWFLRRTAQCLSASVVPDNDMHAAEAEFLRTAAIPISVGISGPGVAGDGCALTQGKIGPRAVCAPGAQSDFQVTVSARLGSVNHTFSEEVKTVRYKSGTRQVPNPQKADREREYLDAQRDVDNAESELSNARSNCSSNPRGSDCSRAQSLQSSLSSYRSSRDSARNRLRDTPATVTEDVYSDANYRVRHHEWTVPSTVSARRGSGRDPVESHDSFVYADVEQEAVPQAGIPRDPLDPPNSSTWDRSLLAQSIAASTATLDRAFAEAATCSFEGASIDTPGLECRVRSTFYTSSAMPQPTLWLGKKFRCEK